MAAERLADVGHAVTLHARNDRYARLADAAFPTPVNAVPGTRPMEVGVVGRGVSGGPGDVLLERDRQLELIGGCLGQARQGRGGALMVEGPAGIGKTVLLAAARDAARARGFRVLRARGAELEQGFAFGVVRQLFEPAVAGASEDERARLLDGPPGVAARLLSLPGLGGGHGATVVTDPTFAVLHGLYWLCANLAAEGPVALMVDDAHWADGASLRFLAFLLPRLEELPAAVLMAARPAEAGDSQGLLAALAMDPAAEVVAVAPLSHKGVAALVAAGLGAEPEPEFAWACREATGGIPFLVRTLVEALREERVAPDVASAPTVHKVATTTLGRWAMLRLGRLGADAARLARAVAVMEQAELDQAARLADLELPAAARAADLLVQAGVLGDVPLGFAHPLLRGAVYHDIAISERAEAHRRAARLLAEAHAGPARVAEHLLATVPAGDRWTVGQLQAAGRDTATRGATESAAAYLRRALSEPPPPELEGGMLLELGLAEFSAGQPGWHGHLKAAVESAGDDATRIAAALLFANVLRWHRRTAEAIEVCDRVAAGLGGRDPDGRLTLEAMAVACGVLDVSAAPAVAGRVGALLARAAEPSAPRPCLAAAAYVAALANHPADQVADLALRAISAATLAWPEPGVPPWVPGGAFRHPSAVLTLLWAERYDAAQALADSAVAEAQASPNAMILPMVLSQRAWLALRRGDLAAAEADARAVLDGPGPPVSRHRAARILADVLIERGDLGEAEQTLKQVIADLGIADVTATIERHTRGRLRFAQHRFAEALSDFQAAGEIAAGGLATCPSYLPWRSDAALAALAVGEFATARHLSDEELHLARAFGAPRALGVALRAAGLVAGGQHGEDLLREAVDVLAGPDTRLEHARAMADLGALLRRGNHRAEARCLLRQAADVAHHHGANALAGQAETDLRATGAKPRPVRLTGIGALTASELRTAELAADGLTNREIAHALYITARTVEGHLTNVFRKLDIKARSYLPTALIGDG